MISHLAIKVNCINITRRPFSIVTQGVDSFFSIICVFIQSATLLPLSKNTKQQYNEYNTHFCHYRNREYSIVLMWFSLQPREPLVELAPPPLSARSR